MQRFGSAPSWFCAEWLVYLYYLLGVQAARRYRPPVGYRPHVPNHKPHVRYRLLVGTGRPYPTTFYERISGVIAEALVGNIRHVRNTASQSSAFVTLSCLRYRANTPCFLQGIAASVKGGGPSPSLHLAVLHISHGGAETSARILPILMYVANLPTLDLLVRSASCQSQCRR